MSTLLDKLAKWKRPKLNVASVAVSLAIVAGAFPAVAPPPISVEAGTSITHGPSGATSSTYGATSSTSGGTKRPLADSIDDPTSSTGARKRIRYRGADGKMHRTLGGEPPKSRYECLSRARSTKSDLAAINKSSGDGNMVVEAVNQAMEETKVRLKLTAQLRSTRNRKTCVILRRGKRVTFSSRQIVGMTFCKSSTMMSKGREFGCSASTCRMFLQAGVYCFLAGQAALLQKHRCSLEESPPDWAYAAPSWDETSMRLRINVAGKRMKTSMQVVVYNCMFAWGGEGRDVQYFNVIVPPMPSTGTSAAKLWDCITCHPWTQELTKFKYVLFKKCSLAAIQPILTDAATGNTKLVAHAKNVEPKSWITEHNLCNNHQAIIGENTTTASVLGPLHLKQLYSVPAYMNAGTHMLRCACACLEFVQGALSVQPGRPSESEGQLNKQFLDFFTKDANGEDSKYGRSSEFTGATTFFTTVYGDYSIMSEKARLIVYTEEPITPELQVDLCTRVANAIMAMLFCKQWPVPSCSKWTKAFPAVKKQLQAMIGGIFRGISQLALGKLTYRMKVAVDGEEHQDLLDDHVLSWNHCMGVRAKSLRRAVLDISHCIGIGLRTLVQEHWSVVHLKLMEYSRRSKVPSTDSIPVITMLSNDTSSVAYVVLCSLSTLMAGLSDRLDFVLALRGVKDQAMWADRFPEDLELLAQLLSSGMAALERRLRRRVKDNVFGATHPEVARPERLRRMQALVVDIDDHHLQGLRLHLSLRHKGKQDAAVHVLADVEELARGAHVWDASICKLENLHAQNRHRAGHSNQTLDIATLASASVASQAEHEIEVTKEVVEPKTQEVHGQAIAISDKASHAVRDPEPVSNRPNCFRFAIPAEAFRAHRLRVQAIVLPSGVELLLLLPETCRPCPSALLFFCTTHRNITNIFQLGPLCGRSWEDVTINKKEEQ